MVSQKKIVFLDFFFAHLNIFKGLKLNAYNAVFLSTYFDYYKCCESQTLVITYTERLFRF